VEKLRVIEGININEVSYGDSTQLLYLRARWYNPANGRFQSRDTWGGDANRPISMNRWMYVEGNPVNYSDPTGHNGVPGWAIKILEDMRAKTELCYSNSDRLCVWENYYALSLFAPVFGYAHSSDHLENYLLKLGDRHYYGGVGIYKGYLNSSQWVFEDRLIRPALRGKTKEMWRQIHLNVLAGQTSGHVKTQESHSNYPEGSTDTWYALGDFMISVEADWEKEGCDVTIKPIYHFSDKYDWHPEKDLVAGGGVGGLAGFKDAWAKSLLPDMAAEYTNYGSWNGPNKVYHFSSAWLDWSPNKNNYLSWDYADSSSSTADIFHFDD
jgi:RHS repeat-associated protein